MACSYAEASAAPHDSATGCLGIVRTGGRTPRLAFETNDAMFSKSIR